MLIGASNAVAATTLFDTTVQGPVGGAELCVDTTSSGIGGARDIHLTGTFSERGAERHPRSVCCRLHHVTVRLR